MLNEAMVLSREDTIGDAMQSDCCHHWIIEAPNGANSLGTCKSCGAQREFVNSVDIKRDWRKKRTPVPA